MILKNKKYIFTLLILIVLILIGYNTLTDKHECIVFVENFISCDTRDLDNFIKNENGITSYYSSTILENTKPSQYFGDAFADFKNGYEIIGNRNNLIPKKYSITESNDHSTKYLSVLVKSKREEILSRFIFQKKQNKWILFDITFE
jgi:hypothetical protein